MLECTVLYSCYERYYILLYYTRLHYTKLDYGVNAYLYSLYYTTL